MDQTGKNKAEYVKETFNLIANRYDLINTIITLGMDKKWRSLAVQQVKAKPGANILDVCCGTGQLTFELAKAVGSNGKVIGLDFSEKMLAVARQHFTEQIAFQQQDWGDTKLIQGDALSLPFDNNSFDGVTIGWGLRNLTDIPRGIKEMMRVVKPGGIIVSLDMAKPYLLIYKQLYWLYFKKLVPLMGRLLAKNESAYSYLFQSAKEFPSQQEVAAIFEECGLKEIGYRNLSGGVVALVSGIKSKQQ
jgi:demethylmenaquinone methyltransferase/2-methoxy-6-polyprenyl-1,4-benzoquinol methylase